MTLRLRLLSSFVAVLAGPLAIALMIVDAPLAAELLVFGIAVLIGIALALAVSYAIAKPIQDLARAAARAAEGDLSAPIGVATADEVGLLARAFNDLAERVRTQVLDVESSRDEVRNSVRRLGEALRSTGPKDLSKLLSVVLETALVAVRGKSGAIFLLSANRTELYVKVGRRLDPSIAEQRIAIGAGLAGWVAAHRTHALVPSLEGPAPADPEPVERASLAVPLETQSQLLGVLAVYGREVPEAFRDEDVEIVSSLARQAGVGVDNVLLHQEAERLSITDGLTGIWNRRHFQMRLAEEFARVLRNPRPLALLMLDIDHFKQINDRYGHQRGDGILVELAQRVIGEIRGQLDVFARYGGEEFVLLLPETDLLGARIVAEKIRESVAASPFGSADDTPVSVSVSVGYAAYPKHGDTPHALVRSADQAMYAAKQRGRNLVVGAEEI